MVTSVRNSIFGLGLMALVALPETALAQSFSCRTTENCTESVICSEPRLGRLDERMADRYFALKREAGRREARRLLDSQRAWLAERNTCGCNADCLITYYRNRIRLFDELLGE